MRTPWIRRRPGPDENRKAAGAGLAVGAVIGAGIGAGIFYFARIILARERIDRPGMSGRAPRRRDGEGEEE